MIGIVAALLLGVILAVFGSRRVGGWILDGIYRLLLKASDACLAGCERLSGAPRGWLR